MPSDRAVNYSHLDYRQRLHHARYKRRVEAEGFTCQECGGTGGEVDRVLDYGQGPWIPCGFCEGIGKVTRWMRGQWLRWKKKEKADAV